jgi:tryptophan 2,3-dioxygenase
MKELASWLLHPKPTRFPYDVVVGEYHRVGKHFVHDNLLAMLARARDAVDHLHDPFHGSALLNRFLQTALDKWDGRYDYPTYTGLALLPMPSVDDPPEQLPYALPRRDRLVIQLIADLLDFELAASEGRTDVLPEMRPDTRTTTKRCRLARNVAAPALRRLGLAGEVTATDPEEAARALCAAVQPELSALDRRILQLSMLPVYVVHDEYMFIRVLQLFEITFAMIAVELRGAVYALAAHEDCRTATLCIDVAEKMLRESAPLFSLAATMRVEAFQTFREFTEGASAIQSRNYKILESLCRTPDPDRLASAAYLSVPEVRERVLAGNYTLDEAFQAASDSGYLTGAEVEKLSAAMGRFAATLRRWRQTHYSVARRMLGDQRPGTGATEGTPYLKAVRTIPVFRSVAHTEGDVDLESA